MASYRRSYVVEVETDTPAYVWSGVGDLEVASKTYSGAGELLSLPDLRQLINGISERIEFTISGVSEQALRMLVEDKASLYLAEAKIGYVEFDNDWQLAGSVVYEWQGIADLIETTSESSEGGRTRIVKIGLSRGESFRSNPKLAFFTDADQKKRSATDAIFSHVAGIDRGVTRRFGPK